MTKDLSAPHCRSSQLDCKSSGGCGAEAPARSAHDPEKLVIDLVGHGNRVPAGACARAGQRPDPSAKPASAGEARSEKIMRKQNVREAQGFNPNRSRVNGFGRVSRGLCADRRRARDIAGQAPTNRAPNADPGIFSSRGSSPARSRSAWSRSVPWHECNRRSPSAALTWIKGTAAPLRERRQQRPACAVQRTITARNTILSCRRRTRSFESNPI